MKLITLFTVCLTSFLFACSNDSSANKATEMQTVTLQELQNNWQLISIDNETVKSASNLNIDSEAQATGNLACNNFFGALAINENQLRIDKMGSTRKMCEPEVNSIEMTVASVLSAWSTINIVDQSLTLTNENHTLVYTIAGK